MTDKHDAKEVIHLALLEIGHGPQVHNGVQAGIFAVGGGHLDVEQLVGARVGQVINAAVSAFPVHAHDGAQHVIVQLGLQGTCQVMPLGVGYGDQRELAGGVYLGLGAQLCDFVLYFCHISMGFCRVDYYLASSVRAWPSYLSSGFSLRFTPPKYFCTLILRCNCIRA